jgi:hypothetical protein
MSRPRPLAHEIDIITLQLVQRQFAVIEVISSLVMAGVIPRLHRKTVRLTPYSDLLGVSNAIQGETLIIKS